jgi:sugar fermentation stimulation protein A
MIFENELLKGTMIKRYKRFMADVTLADGSVVTAHCPNSGSMKGCWEEGWDVRLSESDNPKRKLKYTLEMTHNGVCWIGTNTQHPNRIVYDAMVDGLIPELGTFAELKREVKYGTNSRIDVLGTTADGKRCYVEVKNVTMIDDDGRYAFPDAVTTRGQKHLDELITCVKAGDDAAMVFTIQRSDGSGFCTANDIDPVYAEKLLRAKDVGVKILPYLVDVSPQEILLSSRKVEFLP